MGHYIIREAADQDNTLVYHSSIPCCNWDAIILIYDDIDNIGSEECHWIGLARFPATRLVHLFPCALPT